MWYRDGELLYEQPEGPWEGDDVGNWWVSVFNDEGLDDGIYTVEIYYDGELVGSGDTQIGGAPGEDAVFTPVLFALDVDDSGNPVDVVDVVPADAMTIVFFFDYEGMTDGRIWKVVWYADDMFVYDSGESPWDLGTDGTGWASVFNSDQPLATGEWRVEIIVEGTTLAQATIEKE